MRPRFKTQYYKEECLRPFSFICVEVLGTLQCYIEVETEARRCTNGFFPWPSKHSDDLVAGEKILILCYANNI